MENADTPHIGILAPEFPPAYGGMPKLALALSQELARLTPVSVYTSLQSGIESPPFPLRSILPENLAKIPKLLEPESPDVWLALNAGYSPLASKLKQPFFAYYHGNDFLTPWIACGPNLMERIRRPYLPTFRQSVRRHSLRKSVQYLEAILCNSRNTAELIESKIGVTRKKIAICPPGVDDIFFEVRRRAPPTSTLRLLTIAGLRRSTRRKNIDGVLHAVRVLRDQIRIRYTVVGDGDDLSRLRRLASHLGISDIVDFCGPTSQAELLQRLSETDLFVLASKATNRDVEGFGIVYLEASAAGVPSICSKEGGATDAVIDGVNGLVIEKSSAEHVAKGVMRFMSERTGFKPERIREVAEKHRWSKMAKRVHGVIVHSRRAPLEP